MRSMRFTSYLRFLALAFGFLLLPALASAQDSVKCESNDGHRQYCGRYDADRIRMDRQISGSPCVQDETWGVDREGLWVDRGCRAIFVLVERRPERDDRSDRSDRDDRDRDRPRAQSSVTCSSNDGRRQYCGRYESEQVRLDHQISNSACVQDETWGVDREGLWVDRGCRAVFTVFEGRRRDVVRDDDRRDNNRRDAPREEIWWEADPRAVWPPRGDWHGGRWESGGACFYQDFNFSGRFFCLRRGEARESLGNYGDKISSVRAFGGARVILFDDRNFSGASERVRVDVDDLRRVPVAQKHGHTWNDRVSSIRVE
ncbi:MAG TPA: DUF3011 domain-containing protein [Candidatus Acidoferrum sp.]